MEDVVSANQSINGILNTYNLPREAVTDLPKLGLVANQNGGGLTTFSGHDSGIPFIFTVENELVPEWEGDKIVGQKQVQYEAIQWIVGRRHKPMDRLKLRPDLVTFGRDGEPIGGKYLQAYLRFKEGQAMEGTWIRKWDKLSDTDSAMLEQRGIFTVEQFAEIPRNRIVSEFPEGIVQAHDAAKFHSNAEAEHAKELAAMRAEIESLKAALSGGQNEKLAKATKPAKKTTSKRKAQ